MCCSAKVLNVDDSGTEADEVDGHPGGGSGGYLEYILRHSASALLGVTVDDLKYKTLRFVHQQSFSKSGYFPYIIILSIFDQQMCRYQV